MRSPPSHMRFIVLAAGLGLLCSCVSTTAMLDRTFYKGITWPGEPEKPRIHYLWSLRDLTGGGRITRLMGDEEVRGDTDPRYSEFLVNPQGVFVTQDEILYVTDTGAGRVSVVDLKTQKSKNIIGGRSFGLINPIGVVVDPSGNVYVTDAELRGVAVFNDRGKFKRFFTGELRRPTGIAIAPDASRIYVADTWAHRVYIYNPDGRRIGSLGDSEVPEERFDYPTHITVDREGNLYVADTLNFKVKAFSPEGDLLINFGDAGDSYIGFDKIKGIAVDSEGHIYISDSLQDMVKIYDKEGRMLLFFGERGSFYGQFSHPAGIYIDSRDRVYVADMLNRRVQAFQFLGGG